MNRLKPTIRSHSSTIDMERSNEENDFREGDYCHEYIFDAVEMLVDGRGPSVSSSSSFNMLVPSTHKLNENIYILRGIIN